MHVPRPEPRTHGDETWTKKCRTTGWTGDRWKLLHKTDKDGDVWSVAFAPLAAKRLKSSPYWWLQADNGLTSETSMAFTGNRRAAAIVGPATADRSFCECGRPAPLTTDSGQRDLMFNARSKTVEYNEPSLPHRTGQREVWIHYWVCCDKRDASTEVMAKCHTEKLWLQWRSWHSARKTGHKPNV